MPLTVQHDRGNNQLHLIFRNDRIIASQEWCAPNAIISLAADNEALNVTILGYYTERTWFFTEEWVEHYGLREHEDDLKLVWQSFFAPPSYAVKTISYEDPETGEEIIIAAPEANDA